MSALATRLSALLDEGHRTPVPDLLSDDRFDRAPQNADAAVLIAITEREEPGVLLTQRPNTMRSHPGQVAFPGGKIDPGEDAVAAALREAHEELAIAPKSVRVIGVTDAFKTGTGFHVTPVVGVVPPDLTLIPNPAEVEAWFEAPLQLLLERQHWQVKEAVWQGQPRSYLELQWDGFRIWGVTAAIIANLSRRIAVERLFDDH